MLYRGLHLCNNKPLFSDLQRVCIVKIKPNKTSISNIFVDICITLSKYTHNTIIINVQYILQNTSLRVWFS